MDWKAKYFTLDEFVCSCRRPDCDSAQIQFRMLRSLVSYMPDLTPEIREKILNEGNGK